MLFIDADRFKAFNDSYGHTEGDACLRAVASAVQETASRAGDLAVRFGGEEFVVVLPETDAAGALRLAERVRSDVCDLAIPHRLNAPFGIATVSIGVATALPGQTMAAPEELVAEADRALYRAKSTGRNRASFAELSLHWDASADLRQSG
jgi:diguanylate cyclase (GGDEF)-like protein